MQQVVQEISPELKETREIEAWLRQALTVFSRVSSANVELKEAQRVTVQLNVQAQVLREEKDVLEKWLEAARGEGKELMPDCPIPTKEFQSLWNQGSGYARPLISKLAALWGIEIKM